jgi:hypothetical protein
MTDTLKNIIVRDPVSGRMFLVEKDPTPKAAPLTLRRLDREPREQAHVYRTRQEVLAMGLYQPMTEIDNRLQQASRAVLLAWDGYLKTKPDARPDAFLTLVQSLHGLGELVEP